MKKRFEVIDDGYVDIYDHNRIDIVCTCDMPNDAKKCCKLLNELYEENQRLKYDNKHQQNYINQLLKKPKLTDVLPQAMEIIEINDELEKENEELRIIKKKYERLIHLLSTV